LNQQTITAQKYIPNHVFFFWIVIYHEGIVGILEIKKIKSYLKNHQQHEELMERVKMRPSAAPIKELKMKPQAIVVPSASTAIAN